MITLASDFGNTVSNVPGEMLAGHDSATVDGQQAPVRRAYAAVADGDRFVTVGSHGFVEFAVNQGRGDEAFGLAAGDAVTLRWLVR